MPTRTFSTMFDALGMVRLRSTEATLSSVADTDSSTTLAAENTDRVGLLVFNDSAAALYLKYGATASSTSFTVKIAAGGYWEMPRPVYVGLIDGIWASNGSGAARVTELT